MDFCFNLYSVLCSSVSGLFVLQIHATTSKYFKARYDKFVKEVSSYLKKVDYSPKEVAFCFCSPFPLGSNLPPTFFHLPHNIMQKRSQYHKWIPYSNQLLNFCFEYFCRQTVLN
ncbi:hypothetical protein AAZX31_12G071100 [Glycine max]|nr:hypothetical protein JHK86_033157 [Glycine max]